MIKSPFKFLDSYTKEDRKIFFGREREIEELYHRVFESKIMLVYGVSGTGKSSLIHCGLANKFQETDWLPLNIRRGGNILESFASAVKIASITQQTGEIINPTQFKKSIRSLYLDHYKPVFFIFDQFEELFIFGNKDEKRAFVQVIKTLLDSDLQCRFIFVMREEYMANITEFEKFIPTIFSNRVRIEKMSHLNAVEAIKGPCKIANIDLEEGFAETLLEKLSPQSADVELTYLQVFLDRILRLASNSPFEGGQGGCSFTLSLLSRVGNVTDLLGSFLDEQVSLLPEPDTAMTVLKAFVSDKGTKRPANEAETIDNVRSLGKEISPEKVPELLQTFVKLRVLRDKDDHGRYELRHDALAEKIFEKFSLAEKELLEMKQFIENAYQVYIKRRILLNSDDLSYIAGRDISLNLRDQIQDFMKECRKHQEAMKRSVKRLTAISAVAFIIVLAILIYKIVAMNQLSKARQYALESAFQLSDPLDRLQRAASAWALNKGIESKEALLKAFNFAITNTGQDSNLILLRHTYSKEFTPVTSKIESANCSHNNKFIYGYTKDSIIIWNEKGSITNKISISKIPLINLRVSNDDSFLAGVNIDSILTVWDLNGNIQFEKKVRFNSMNINQIFRFTKENEILSLSTKHDAELLDLKGNVLQVFDHHKSSVNGLDLSKDGLFMATASSDKTVDIWHYSTKENKFSLYNVLDNHSDTVWSAFFAHNGRYILSTSADGSIRLTSVNKDKLGMRNYKSLFGDLNIFPVQAAFGWTDSVIVIKCFQGKYRSEKMVMIGDYVNLRYEIATSGNKTVFDKLAFSPDNVYFANTTDDGTYLTEALTKLYTDNKNRLLRMEGTDPFFSPDGKYLYTISGYQIKSVYIDIRTISEIALNSYL